MRIALLADMPPGNAIALEAVLADIGMEGGADAFWVLGDLVAIGPDPVGVLERLSSLAGLRVIRGNTTTVMWPSATTGPAQASRRYKPMRRSLHR